MEKPKLASRLNRLFEYRPFQVGFGALALLLAYVFASFALDSGSLLDYAITFLLILIGLRELFLGIFKTSEPRQS